MPFGQCCSQCQEQEHGDVADAEAPVIQCVATDDAPCSRRFPSPEKEGHTFPSPEWDAVASTHSRDAFLRRRRHTETAFSTEDPDECTRARLVRRARSVDDRGLPGLERLAPCERVKAHGLERYRLSTKLASRLGIAPAGGEEDGGEGSQALGEVEGADGEMSRCTSPETPPVTPKGVAVKNQDMFFIAHLVHRAVQAFQKSGKVDAATTHAEKRRRIKIEQIYDFYNPQTGKTRVRKMFSRVLHRREGAGRGDGGADADADASESGSESSDTESLGGPSDIEEQLSTRRRDSQGPSSKSPDSAGNSPRGGTRSAAGKLTNVWVEDRSQDALANWGLIVGKVLFSKILDFQAVTSRAATFKRRLEPAKCKSGTVLASVRERARLVAKQGLKLARKVAQQDDCYDKEWPRKRQNLLATLFSTQYTDTLLLLARAAAKMISVQDVVVEADAPCRIYGDLHGQLRDLLLFFVAFGSPLRDDAPQLIFNGDFVDRGAHQLETIGYLLALKVLLPEKVWLLRGNHESRTMNMRYGFHEECTKKLGKGIGQKVFDSMQRVFDQLPLACVINRRVLVVHGGLGDGAWTIDELQAVRRPLDSIENDSWLNSILWSDPIPDDDTREAGVFGVHQSPRGGNAIQFGWNVTKTFCAREGIGLVVRSHQSKQDSYGFDVMHDMQLIRVFSARDYEGHGNDGAMLYLQKKVLDEQGELVDAPRRKAKANASKASKAKDQDFIISVRAQVLRSVKKTRVDEEQTAAGKAG